MGLLDEAIREHLELKRRRGADPGEVALQERAALDPAYPEHPEAAEEPHHEYDEAPVHDEAEPGHEHAPQHHEDAAAFHHDPPPLDPGQPPHDGAPVAFGTPGQETAEFDMEAILESDVHEGHQGDPLGHQAIHHGTAAPGEEQIEWETPARPGEQQELPEQIPGQERLSFE